MRSFWAFGCAVVLMTVGLAWGAPPARAGISDTCPNDAAGQLVTLANGATYCGRTSGNVQTVAAFQGIQYATAARLAEPSVLTPSGANPAKNYKAVCPQVVSKDSTSYKIGVEDCLYLNVWAPKTPSSSPNGYPVLFWVHGGAFVFGSSADGSFDPSVSPPQFDADGGLYDGSSFAAQGIVVVTINYRLGALGFLAYEPKKVYGISAPYLPHAIPGNYGIMDQVAALNWVNTYISGFGGDPSRISIAGESAGAMSVGLLNYSNARANSMATAAIMESNPMGVVYERQVKAGSTHGMKHHELTANAFLGNLCSTYAGLINQQHHTSLTCDDLKGSDWLTEPYGTYNMTPTVDLILQSQGWADATTAAFVLNPRFSTILPWTPVLGRPVTNPDYALVDNQPLNGYASGFTAHPVLFGTNLNEGVLFVDPLASKISMTTYNSIINGLFAPRQLPSGDATVTQAVEQYSTSNFAGATVNPYCPGSSTSPTINCSEPAGFLSTAPANAFAAVGTDVVFRCGNAASAAKVAAAGAKTHGYVFTNAPAMAMFGKPGDGNPCNEASQDNAVDGHLAVCHGYELPYVFNTLETIADQKDKVIGSITQDDLTVASKMNGDWGRFVSDAASFTPNPSQMVGDYAIYGGQSAVPDGVGSVVNAAACGTGAYNLFGGQVSEEGWPNQ